MSDLKILEHHNQPTALLGDFIQTSYRMAYFFVIGNY